MPNTIAEAGALPNQNALAGTSLVRVIGEPTTPNEAATLAEEDKFRFQWWALGLVGARPVEQKKGADHGIDAPAGGRPQRRSRKVQVLPGRSS
jgi:hypothetical protein